MLVQGPGREVASDQSGAIHACTALPALIEIHTEADTAPGKTCVFHASDALRASIVRVAPHGERSPGPHSGEIGVLPPAWGARGARGGAARNSPPNRRVRHRPDRAALFVSAQTVRFDHHRPRRAARGPLDAAPTPAATLAGTAATGLCSQPESRNRSHRRSSGRQVLPRVALAELNLRATERRAPTVGAERCGRAQRRRYRPPHAGPASVE